MSNYPITVRRIYEGKSDNDGTRILVDRLWPRGLTKEAAAVDIWLKEIAPSNELRKWFHADMSQWDEFHRRYLAELQANPEPLQKLLTLAGNGPITLLYSSRETEHNHAMILVEMLKES